MWPDRTKGEYRSYLDAWAERLGASFVSEPRGQLAKGVYFSRVMLPERTLWLGLKVYCESTMLMTSSV